MSHHSHHTARTSPTAPTGPTGPTAPAGSLAEAASTAPGPIDAPAPTGAGFRRHLHLAPATGERGITTAEYAVGTAAGAGLAGLLYTLLTGGLGNRMLTSMFDHVLGLLGIG